MDNYQNGQRATGTLGEPNTRDNEDQDTDMPSSSSTPLFPGTFTSNVNAELLQLMFPSRNSALSDPHNFLNSASRSSLVTGTESQRNLSPAISNLPAARSTAERMPTLEQQLASLLKEEQQRARPLTIEQQLAAFIEQQGRSTSFQRSSSLPSDRVLNLEHQLPSSLEQQQQDRHQPFQATNTAPDRMPTLEQLLASLEDEQRRRRSSFQSASSGSFQPTSSLPNGTSTFEDQLASSIEQQQGIRAPFQERRMPNIEHQLASLIQAADFTNPSSCFPSNILTEHQPSLMPSPEHLQLLEQLQRGFVPQAQPDLQAQTGGSNFGNANDGYLECPLPLGPPPSCPLPLGPPPSGVPRELPVPMPPPYGSQEKFPGKLYSLLIEAEREGNDHIISFTPDGCTFKIHDREAFIEVESPKHFRHTHITSFVRQLNFYGFKRQSKGPNRGGFGHPFFLRGHPELLVMIEKKDDRPRAKKGR
jgi:hypothetical protein